MRAASFATRTRCKAVTKQRKNLKSFREWFEEVPAATRMLAYLDSGKHTNCLGRRQTNLTQRDKYYDHYVTTSLLFSALFSHYKHVKQQPGMSSCFCRPVALLTGSHGAHSQVCTERAHSPLLHLCPSFHCVGVGQKLVGLPSFSKVPFTHTTTAGVLPYLNVPCEFCVSLQDLVHDGVHAGAEFPGQRACAADRVSRPIRARLQTDASVHTGRDVTLQNSKTQNATFGSSDRPCDKRTVFDSQTGSFNVTFESDNVNLNVEIFFAYLDFSTF